MAIPGKKRNRFQDEEDGVLDGVAGYDAPNFKSRGIGSKDMKGWGTDEIGDEVLGRGMSVPKSIPLAMPQPKVDTVVRKKKVVSRQQAQASQNGPSRVSMLGMRVPGDARRMLEGRNAGEVSDSPGVRMMQGLGDNFTEPGSLSAYKNKPGSQIPVRAAMPKAEQNRANAQDALMLASMVLPELSGVAGVGADLAAGGTAERGLMGAEAGAGTADTMAAPKIFGFGERAGTAVNPSLAERTVSDRIGQIGSDVSADASQFEMRPHIPSQAVGEGMQDDYMTGIARRPDEQMATRYDAEMNPPTVSDVSPQYNAASRFADETGAEAASQEPYAYGNNFGGGNSADPWGPAVDRAKQQMRPPQMSTDLVSRRQTMMQPQNMQSMSSQTANMSGPPAALGQKSPYSVMQHFNSMSREEQLAAILALTGATETGVAIGVGAANGMQPGMQPPGQMQQQGQQMSPPQAVRAGPRVTQR